MLSWLWSVAAETVVPARRTGSTITFGVKTPVRPTCTTISSTRLSFFSGGYLKATAQRGALAVLPSSRRWERELILMTAPSISKGSSPRCSPSQWIRSTQSRMLS